MTTRSTRQSRPRAACTKRRNSRRINQNNIVCHMFDQRKRATIPIRNGEVIIPFGHILQVFGVRARTPIVEVWRHRTTHKHINIGTSGRTRLILYHIDRKRRRLRYRAACRPRAAVPVRHRHGISTQRQHKICRTRRAVAPQITHRIRSATHGSHQTAVAPSRTSRVIFNNRKHQRRGQRPAF